MIFATLFLLLLGTGANAQNSLGGAAPIKSTSEAQILGRGEVKSLSVPRFGIVGHAVCDASGNMFFNVSQGTSHGGPFLGILNDGSKHRIYTLPPEASSFGTITWAVSPDGSFYVLNDDLKSYKLTRFKDDGNVAAVTSLDMPAGIQIEQLAVADSGIIYTGGYRQTSKPSEKASGYAALFASSGKQMRDLSSDASPVNEVSLAQHPTEGDVIAASDGFFYIMQSANVLVMNQLGEVERILKFQKKDHDALANNIYYSDGTLAVIFYLPHYVQKHATDIQVHPQLIDAQTGEDRGDYVFAPGSPSYVVCFDAKDGFTVIDNIDSIAAKGVIPVR